MGLKEFCNVFCGDGGSKTSPKFDNHCDHTLVTHSENRTATITWINSEVHPVDLYRNCHSSGFSGGKYFCFPSGSYCPRCGNKSWLAERESASNNFFSIEWSAHGKMYECRFCLGRSRRPRTAKCFWHIREWVCGGTKNSNIVFRVCCNQSGRESYCPRRDCQIFCLNVGHIYPYCSPCMNSSRSQ